MISARDLHQYLIRSPTAHSDYKSLAIHNMGIDILSKLPLARGKSKYMVVTVDYFTKYLETEALVTITMNKIIRFVYQTIFCRYTMRAKIVSDNGM